MFTFGDSLTYFATSIISKEQTDVSYMSGNELPEGGAVPKKKMMNRSFDS